MSPFIIISILLLFIGTAFTSLAELSISSVNPLKMKHLAESGSKAAQAVLDIRGHSDMLFGSLLVTNTLINVIIPILFLRLITAIASNNANLAETLTVVISSIFITVLEVFAKTLGSSRAEKAALLTSIPVLVLIKITYLPVKAINIISNTMNKLIGVDPKFEDNPATLDDLRQIIRSAAEGGHVKTEEEIMMRKLSFIGGLSANDIMTPRTDVTLLPERLTCKEALKQIVTLPYSRYPIHGEKIDDIVGVLHTRDLFVAHETDSITLLHDIARNALFVPETAPVQEVLNVIRKEHAHMLIVVDEYGTPVGIITLEDIVEEIIGDIWDEFDVEQFEISVDDSGIIHSHGRTPLRLLAEEHNIHLASKSKSLGGYILQRLGSIPESGAKINAPGLQITVESMSGKKIDKVLIVRSEQKAEISS